MTKLFKILFFYSIVGLIITGLLGFYPRIDPSFVVFNMHKDVATYSIYLLLFVQVMGVFLFFKLRGQIKTTFYKTELGVDELKSSLKHLNKMLLAICINLPLIIFTLVSGILLMKGSISKPVHFHGNMTCLTLLIFSFIYILSKLETSQRILNHYQRVSGFNYIEPPFIDDENKRGFDLALKFLFLGINVWTPYLILKYLVGLTMLKGLYFLPIHLAGVIPFSILKRKYKFARTINPNYKGAIKKREKYNTVSE
ncbi:MAG: hypothetical protein KC646_16760 [Candidatus Cloacimonetes bacterium]|nr:hypothetical protein [Candidatus Cloacimonadota bacterium]